MVNLPGLFNSVPLIHKEISGHCITHRIGRYIIEQSVNVCETDTGLTVQHLVQQTSGQSHLKSEMVIAPMAYCTMRIPVQSGNVCATSCSDEEGSVIFDCVLIERKIPFCLVAVFHTCFKDDALLVRRQNSE